MITRYARFGLLATLMVGSAAAYETDQLTRRDHEIDDAIPPGNARMRAAVELAVRDTNKWTRCTASDARAERLFANALYRLTSVTTQVKERGGLASQGFEAISAFLEREADTIAFPDRDDLYGDVVFGESPVLAVAGTASTIELSGVRIGTDKIDHFVHFGYLQWRRSNWGDNPERGARWGVRMERTFFGLYTSKAFSFADLAANEAGAEFYAGLFEAGGPVAITEGCVTHTDSPFDWRDWVTEDWDEVVNPSVYSARVAIRVRDRVRDRADEYCPIYQEQLGGSLYDDALAQRFATIPTYADVPRVPMREDPFQLAEACVE